MEKVIWIINHYAITPEYPGGTRHYEIALRLSEMGFNVVIFASSVLHQNSTINILGEKQKIKIVNIKNNFKFIWINTLTYKNNNLRRLINMFSFVFRMLMIYKKMILSKEIKHPDIIIGSTVHPFVPLLARYIANKLSAIYIFEIRDLWPQSFIDLGLWRENSLKSRFFLFIEKQSIRNAKSIICLSPLVISYLIKRYKLNKSKIFLIPNGANTITENNSNLKVEFKLVNKNKFNVIFTGAIIVSNRVDIICEAAKLLINQSNIQIVIIGDGNIKVNLIKKYNYLKNIQWIDPIPKNEIQNILKIADLLLLIQGNVAWGSSNKLYDYLSVGKPIVSSVWIPHNDIVSKINSGISVAAEDPQELSEAILKIYYLSDNEKKIMGNNAKEYVNKFHNWDLLSKKFLNAVNNYR